MSGTLDTLDSVDLALRNKQTVMWINPGRGASGKPGKAWGSELIGEADIFKASERFKKFAPVLTTLFPELEQSNGIIESPLLKVPKLQDALGLSSDSGRLFVKADHGLPIAGSIKARGGIHEVLEFAEKIALGRGVITEGDPKNVLSLAGKELLNQYSVAVGSTGNLGLSIGVIASALGFEAIVHMSADAKEWKKTRLRDRGVNVVEHEGDYAAAVAAGRTEAEQDLYCHFVDDESSFSLFVGYSVAALALQKQLAEQQVIVDEHHPLFVYIPCGVGGAPGGIAFGLAHLFGSYVHCFFAEPTEAPCFLVAMKDDSGGHPSVYDIGLSNHTEADGLAVPRASERAVEVMRPVLSGVFTIDDDMLFKHVHTAWQAESIKVEPSATAAFDGPLWVTESLAGRAYTAANGLEPYLANATHIIWTTGGLFVPSGEYDKFYARGESLKG
ncbi:D-serine ammonia-lyase [Pseudomonas sp. FP597]|uniref:Probable D-serine dehydratase n=1 Tax=Pseudomonas lactucae TaxID=2813360 RepID=A0A9X1C5D0_9PSED|nr:MULTISPECIES: D-serine ammonia-lyase [Pseudomonas]MBN2977119.1 D-serine ammonia-lyase [Pseudomonas lactucae]MBN2988211.1 D-serine ammonia-lyase [Pseudomonas lactucae]WLI08859.1 D-serine ammonia-lyase [Pseudomonas sp. FP597]